MSLGISFCTEKQWKHQCSISASGTNASCKAMGLQLCLLVLRNQEARGKHPRGKQALATHRMGNGVEGRWPTKPVAMLFSSFRRGSRQLISSWPWGRGRITQELFV